MKKEKLVFLFIYFLSVVCCLLPVVCSAQEAADVFEVSNRDPFSPLVSKNGTILIPREVDLGGLVVKGIIYSKKSPVVIINNEVLSRGENIGDYLVLEIEKERVILTKDNQEFILKLEEDEKNDYTD